MPSKHFKFIIFLLIMVIRSEGAREQGGKVVKCTIVDNK